MQHHHSGMVEHFLPLKDEAMEVDTLQYILRVLVRDSGVAALAEAGEDGQHTASLLSPQ